ncbi:DNA-binding transcriptional regulator YhcF (GntR family) [Saccharothrix ecbatanensis]|uniref:DNA-binding transcriptional regulator YhcF (GntR family) n=1 Tax=Saccharothrix ecbatanensis TaxID=1105145 RepID=A0A7W9LY84_9PSEU|nr:GntR family transcriptional regulator [Saccharothrix ecbatanensis]MBB5800352.1 DNA-binding transcriptional regulator YhcF (GntR family) [Saccharothrix ecbatanensis]
MTRIVVDPDSGVASWRQVRDQLVHLIRVGELPVGSQLPSIRQLARDLGLSVGTVARVYRELETAGALHTARRNGTVVAAVPSADTDVAMALAKAAADYVTSAKALGADRQDAVQAVLHAYQ